MGVWHSFEKNENPSLINNPILVFQFVNNLKYYSKIDGMVVLPEKHPSNRPIAFFKLIDVYDRPRSSHRPVTDEENTGLGYLPLSCYILRPAFFFFQFL